MTAFCVGLTGGIGCGKSTVAQGFAELGVDVIDTDVLSHALTQPGAIGFNAIIDQFGPRYLLPDETLDRAGLRILIFSDARAKQTLESLLHPLILAQVQAKLLQCSAAYALIVVPLLFETENYRSLIQRSLAVDCSEAQQIERTMARSGLSEAMVRAIMSSQVTRATRLARADDIVCNINDLDALTAKISMLHAKYLSLAREAPAKS